MNQIKVLYLTCLENTYMNNIHQNQVIGLRGNGVDYTFLFISPFFILGKSGFSVNKNSYKDKDIKEVKIPIFSANFNLYLFLIPYFLIIACPIFLYYVYKSKADVVHCRNLVSSLLAVFCKVFLFQKYKVVCDPRSVFVEECVIIGRFKNNGITYRTWKRIERWIYKNSDSCCGLSENFVDYLSDFNKNSFFIPAIVQPTFVYNDEKRQNLRKKFRLSEKQHVCIYLGSIDLWHSVDTLVTIIDSYKKTLPQGDEIKVVFLSGNKKAAQIICNHYSGNDILKCGRVNPNEVMDYLLLADFGIVPGSANEGYCYDLLYNTMLSSKAEEFLSVGLPVIVNKRIVSLVKMIIDQQFGLVFDGKEIVQTPIMKSREEMSYYFNQLFNAHTVVKQYQDLYNYLIDS